MKKILVYFFTLMLIILLTGCSKKEKPEEKAGEALAEEIIKGADDDADIDVDIDGDSSPAQSENEQERNVAIEITPPQGWQAMEGSVLPVHYMKNTASFMVKEEPFTSDTLDGVVDEALEIYGKTFSNLAVQGETETTTIDGKDAKKLTFTCTISKMNMKYLYVYLLVEGKTYVITFGDLADTFDSLSADYETILNNIQFKVQ
ncbi:MAG TPA: hypothetical protein VHT34_02115 [Clostridia bacterium]|nr:hypothetical protein [Clostridia bacterium]